MHGTKVKKSLRALFFLRLLCRLGWRQAKEAISYRLCSRCFSNEGLRLSAEEIGLIDNVSCPNCRSREGRKLTRNLIKYLAYRFFVWGTLQRMDYGAAPLVQFNRDHDSEIEFGPPWPQADVRMIEKAINIGFFHYGPRLWMVGVNIEPLDRLIDRKTRLMEVRRIIKEYPEVTLGQDEVFYRLRVKPDNSSDLLQYDSPGGKREKHNRFDSDTLPVMYASQDLQICIHECRVAVEDEIFVATLRSTRQLKLLDLTEILLHPGSSEFESLDIAVHMLFLAGQHSYEICQEIALSAYKEGYDGLVYPSFYSLLKSGNIPFETSFGLSHRMFPELHSREKAKMTSNLALFGHPLQQGDVEEHSINRMVLRRVQYDFHFGPVGL